MDLKVYHENDWKNYPTKVLAKHTFEWEGEPYSSSPVMIDPLGNVVARNHFIGGTLRLDRPINDGHWESLPPRHVDPDGTYYVSQGYGWSTLSNVPIEPGHVALSFYTRQRTLGTEVVRGEVRISGTFLDANGNEVNGVNGDFGQYHPIPNDGQWHRIIVHAEAPPEATATSSYFLSRASSGDTFDFSRFMVTTGDTEQEALDQIDPYFDGSTQPRGEWMDFKERYPNGVKRIIRSSTPPPPGTHYAWLGERHASESVMLGNDGNETARNHVRDPRFVSSLWSPLLNDPVYGGWEDGHGVAITRSQGGAISRAGFQINLGEYVSGEAVTLSFDAQRVVDGGTIRAMTYNSADAISAAKTITATADRQRLVAHLSRDFEFDRIYLDFLNNEDPGVGGIIGYLDRVRIEPGHTDGTYFDGSTPSDRAHDLWYNAEGVPHEWVNGTNGSPGGWVPLR